MTEIILSFYGIKVKNADKHDLFSAWCLSRFQLSLQIVIVFSYNYCISNGYVLNIIFCLMRQRLYSLCWPKGPKGTWHLDLLQAPDQGRHVLVRRWRPNLALWTKSTSLVVVSGWWPWVWDESFSWLGLVITVILIGSPLKWLAQ